MLLSTTRRVLLCALLTFLMAGSAWAQRLAAGYGHSLVVHPDGTLWAWGDDSSGQLGDGNGYGTQPTPAPIGTATTWASMAAGYYSSAGIRQDGTLWTWGANGYGQLGLGISTSASSPAQVGTATWKSVAMSYFHTLAVRQDGTLWAWGRNDNGQLGDGTTTTRRAPVQVGTATNWVSVSAGQYASAAVQADGTLWTWGYNYAGALGDGTTTQRNTPQQVGTATNWQSVSTSFYFTLAIRQDGTLWAWGFNGQGQLGLGTSSATAYQLVPAQVGTATTWASVGTGAGHAAALRRDGTLWAWGDNTYGQLGDNTTTQRNAPQQVGTATTWLSVAAGINHTLAQRADNSVYAWGLNQTAQLGQGLPFAATLAQIPNYPGPGNWRRAAAGYNTSAAQPTDNTLWTWGRADNGQLGNGTAGDAPIPVQPGSASLWQSTALGYYHALGVRPNGTLWAWGGNQSGQLGGGQLGGGQYSPLQIGTATNWQSVAAGFVFSVGLKTDGTLWNWGDNSLAQLGDGTSGQARTSPAQLGTATNWASVAAGYSHTVAVKTNGTLWAWGQNFNGQVGNGSAGGYQTTPAQVGTATNWVSAAAGPFFTVAVKTDGTLWAWGDNTYGQLGDGTTTQRNLPVQVGTATNWQRVALGYGHAVAVKTDGTLWAWGYNNYGQLGLGTTTNQLVPQQVGTAAWNSISAGSYHTLAVRADGTLWACGLNDHTQLARYSFIATPTLVPNGGFVLAARATSAAPAEWALAPNPAGEQVLVLGLPAGSLSVRVFDAQGRLVRAAAEATLSTVGLAPGLYLLQATVAGQPAGTRRLVVE